MGAITLPAAGDWQARVTATKDGQTGTATFDLRVTDAAAAPPAP